MSTHFHLGCTGLLTVYSGSRDYGKYYSFEQIRELTWDQEAIDAVRSFLTEHEIPAADQEIAPNGEFIKVKASIAKLERMFATEFHQFARYFADSQP